MKELTYFRLPNCPYCRRAENWLAELMDENAAYKKIKITYINEDEQAELADSYDYYYVPTFYCGDKKLHEGAATKEKIKNVLDSCI
jgi:glutaredoxin